MLNSHPVKPFDPFTSFNHIPALAELEEDLKSSGTQFHAKSVSIDSRSEHIIYGYTRRVQSLLSNDNIIPQEIYHLCLLFYQINQHNILWTTHKWNQDDISRKCGIIDMENKSSKTIKSHKFGATQYKKFTTLCYIPSISNIPLNKDNDRNLSAIFAVENDDISGSEKYHPCLICFDADSDDGEITAKYEYESTESILSPHQLLYLEDKHAIIYEYNGKIYSLDLDNVKKEKDLSNFKELQQTNQYYSFDRSVIWRYKHLEMLYLKRLQLLFCVEARHKMLRLLIDIKNPVPVETKCGLFNIGTEIGRAHV